MRMRRRDGARSTSRARCPTSRADRWAEEALAQARPSAAASQTRLSSTRKGDAPATRPASLRTRVWPGCSGSRCPPGCASTASNVGSPPKRAWPGAVQGQLPGPLWPPRVRRSGDDLAHDRIQVQLGGANGPGRLNRERQQLLDQASGAVAAGERGMQRGAGAKRGIGLGQRDLRLGADRRDRRAQFTARRRP